jgi:flagellar hook protein FlgE
VAYDNLGNPVTLDTYFSKTGTNTWEVDVYNDANPPTLLTSQTLTNQISGSQMASTSVSANSTDFRQLAQAYGCRSRHAESQFGSLSSS